jgi:uncharacterized membrane protein
MKKILIIAFIAVIASFAAGAIFYNQMPGQMITHWNAYGVPDGFSPKIIGMFAIPATSLVIILILLGVFYLDPLKNNIKKFINYYYGIILAVVIFLFYIEILTIVSNLNREFNLVLFLVPALAALFYYIGIVVSKAKRNWVVGIRTPWTLSSDYVWDKTHKLSGILFKISAIITLLSLISAKYALMFTLTPLILTALISIVYSYIIYSKGKNNSEKKAKK